MTIAPFNPSGLSQTLRALLDSLPQEKPDISGVSTRRLKALRSEINKVIDRLTRLSLDLDPVMQPTSVFDPADPKTVGTLIAKTLLEQPRVPLSAVHKFYGSSVYAIYYKGDFPAYAPIRGSETPI